MSRRLIIWGVVTSACLGVIVAIALWAYTEKQPIPPPGVRCYANETGTSTAKACEPPGNLTLRHAGAVPN
ncbi:MAG: hypothetical protein L0215_16495 [Gemmataceae bacterium]|nr:hypothetical protein [Gemmataceae bacterium]